MILRTATPPVIAAPGTVAERLKALGTHFAFDTETALAPLSFNGWDHVRLLQFWGERGGFAVDTLDMTANDREAVAAFFAREELEVVMHNAAFDYRVMLGCGVRIAGTLYDTYVASQIIYNGNAKLRHGLGEVVKRELGVVMDKSLQAQDWMNAELGEADIAYALGDVERTWEVAGVLHEKVYSQGLEPTYRLECALIPVVVEMESTGMPLDAERIGEAVAYYAEESAAARECFLETLDGRLVAEGHEGLPRDDDGTFNTRTKDSGSIRLGTKRYAGFNLNSQQQVLGCFALLGIEPIGENGKPTLDKKVLARYQSDELVRMLLNYRKVDKRLGMAQKLIEHCDEDGRIRARFMPLATGTGRFSSSSPNLQNVPRDPMFRTAFHVKPPRCMIVRDFEGMELRIAAVIAKEYRMIDAFNAGVDIHTHTASLMFDIQPEQVTREQRRNSKGVNFGCLYGSGAKGLCNYFATLGIFISMRDAMLFREKWHESYPAFGRWHAECNARAEAGEHMRTVIGRRRYLYGEDNRLTTQANNIVQGTGADITKAAMVEIWRKKPESARFIATVHDELILECDQDDAELLLELVGAEMEAAGRSILGDHLVLTSDGHVAQSWGDAKG